MEIYMYIYFSMNGENCAEVYNHRALIFKWHREQEGEEEEEAKK